MSKFIIKKVGKTPSLKAPVLIEGLPGIGNVARIAAEYLIEKTKAKKFMEIYSFSFPNSVFINDDSTIDMPKIEMFYSKKKRHIIYVTGDIQPVEEKESYKMCEQIIKIAKKMKVKEIITIGGIGLLKEPNAPRVHGATNNKKLIKKFQNIGINFNGNGTVGLIIGAAGLLLGLGGLEGIDGVTLLGETLSHPEHIGMKASRAILKCLEKYLKMDFELKDMDKEIKRLGRGKKSIELLEKELLSNMMKKSKEAHRYIG